MWKSEFSDFFSKWAILVELVIKLANENLKNEKWNVSKKWKKLGVNSVKTWVS